MMNEKLMLLLLIGSKRTNKVDDLMKFDVVLSTCNYINNISLLYLSLIFIYTLDSVIESCFRRQEYGVKRMALGSPTLLKEKSILHKIKWHRIVLDEAHNIKDRACNTARAVVKKKKTTFFMHLLKVYFI